jgi:hypothetical protein
MAIERLIGKLERNKVNWALQSGHWPALTAEGAK